MSELDPRVAEPEDLVADAHVALAECRDAMRALKDDEIAQNHIDFDTAIGLALVVARNVLPWGARLDTLPAYSAGLIDELRRAAKATYAADADVRHARTAQLELTAEARRGFALRTALRTWTEVLIDRRLLPKGALSMLRGGNGYNALGADLLDLVWLTDGCETAKGTGPLDASELQFAATLGAKLFLWRPGPCEVLRVALDRRARAFSLLKAHYAALRRAMRFVLDERADRLIPAFTAGGAATLRRVVGPRLEVVSDDRVEASRSIVMPSLFESGTEESVSDRRSRTGAGISSPVGASGGSLGGQRLRVHVADPVTHDP